MLDFFVSMPGIYYKSNSDTDENIYRHINFLESKCVNKCYPEGASAQSFILLNGSGMLPFSLTRGQSLPSLYSEFGLETLSE